MRRVARWFVAAVLAAGAGAAAPPEGVLTGEVRGMSELPAPVQDTLLHQAAGGGIGQIRKQVDRDGRTVYVARIPSQDSVVRVAPSGRLLTPEK
jgi:hypothetical protein